MAITKAIEDLLNGIQRFVTKIMNDPTLLQKNRQEYNAAVEAWRKVYMAMPSAVKITAEQFGAMLIEQARADRATRMRFVDLMKEPQFPGANATNRELDRFQQDLGKYNRMFEMYSNILKHSHDIQRSIVGNLR